MKKSTLHRRKIFWVYKRVFDILISLLLIPVLISFIAILFILNPFFNKGNIFFIQKRMGQGCKSFLAIKFRSMSNINRITRKYNEPIERERITRLGVILRTSRIDELPQIINVLKGDMSLIGPRPDCYEHALVFLENISGYRDRHVIRPGISGLAQIKQGYAVGLDATHKKTLLDNFYVQNAGYLLDLKILYETLFTIIKRLGS